MRRLLIYTAITSLLAVSAGLAYIGAITLPVRLKTIVISEIEDATGKKVLAQSIRFTILKGVVLEGPVLYDETSVIIRAKEANCAFVIPSIFKKEILLPVINIQSAHILAERRADNSFTLTEIIPKKWTSKSGFAIHLHRIVIRNSHVDFIDRTLAQPFTKKLEGADVDIRFSLPAKAAFTFACKIPSAPEADIRSSGEYSIPREEFSAHLKAKNLSLNEFGAYYKETGLSFPKGAVDLETDLRVKNGVLRADMQALTRGLSVVKDAVNARLDSAVKMRLHYDIKEKRLEYSGFSDIRGMDIAGIDKVGELRNIRAKAEFDNSKLSCEDISVDALGMVWRARMKLVDFKKPALEIHARTETHLSAVQKIMEANFKIKFPADIAGRSDIELALGIEPDHPLELNGSARICDGIIGLGGGNFPIERINGKAQFTTKGLKWSDLDLAYRGVRYRTSGALTDFASPEIQLEAASKDLSFKSVFAVRGRFMRLSELSGRYLNSKFSVSGEIDIGEPGIMDADIKGMLEFDLEDLEKMTAFSDTAKKMKPAGSLRAQFILGGDIKNIKACDIDAKIESGGMSLYGLKASDVAFDYKQAEGTGRLQSARSLFYGGSLSASGKVDWLSKNLPYSFNLDIKDMKLEDFKKDTDFKDRDVAGVIKVYAGLNGLFQGSPGVAGVGKISIARGRLWQLDLFKGLGAVIFTSDFSDIVFTESSCDFRIEDKTVSSDDIILKSELVNLYGSGKIGFDRSVSASLKSELTKEAMDPGFRKNVASAIGKYTFIEISGTLTEPRYRMRPSVSEMVEDAAGALLQR